MKSVKCLLRLSRLRISENINKQCIFEEIRLHFLYEDLSAMAGVKV